MTQLYKLTDQFKQLNEMADDPEMADSVKDTLEGLEMEITDKAVSIVHLMTNRNTDVEALDAEIKRLMARKKQIVSFQDGLKEYLRLNMEALEMTKITCPLFTITLAKGRDVAIIDDVDSLSDEFVKVETTVKPVKADILKALKAGDVIGAHIEKGKTSIRIN